MNGTIWLGLVIMSMVMWTITDLCYRHGVRDDEEVGTCLKYTVCVGVVFFIITVGYLIIRDEPFTIWESAIRFWPLTVFGIIYAVINTMNFKGYIYNEASVESPVEQISGGSSTILLIIVYLVLGRADSIAELLTPLTMAGIALIVVSIILLAMVRNKEFKKDVRYQNSKWMWVGLGTLIFPVIYSLMDALETIVTGVCLDKTFGYAMPEGDGIIIMGAEYSIFALACWIYLFKKEGKPYNPFTKYSSPRLIGSLADNIGIVLYSYAMAMNSISTDPLVAGYPVLVMLGGRIFLKEKLDIKQYIFLFGVILGSVLVIIDTVG
jgi:drug/metabolite transporter (DMT)-like permease